MTPDINGIELNITIPDGMDDLLDHIARSFRRRYTAQDFHYDPTLPGSLGTRPFMRRSPTEKRMIQDVLDRRLKRFTDAAPFTVNMSIGPFWASLAVQAAARFEYAEEARRLLMPRRFNGEPFYYPGIFDGYESPTLTDSELAAYTHTFYSHTAISAAAFAERFIRPEPHHTVTDWYFNPTLPGSYGTRPHMRRSPREKQAIQQYLDNQG